MKLISALFLLLFTYAVSYSKYADVVFPAEVQPQSEKDSLNGKRAFGTLKINPFQILASEIPVSLEIYMSRKLSSQIQAGYIFPLPQVAEMIESFGEGGSVIDEGLLYFRTLPYNNDGGLNLKFELRNYIKSVGNNKNSSYKSFYFAPQIMYKYCYYNYRTFTFFDGNVPYYQTESKDSNILGVGFMIGSQRSEKGFIYDWYTGFGIRVRGIKYTIHEKRYTNRPVYPNTTHKETSVYPFINFGLRMGSEL